MVMDHRFYDDPPDWACEALTVRQRETLTFGKCWQKSVAASALSKTTKLVALVLSLYFSGDEHQRNNPSTERLAQEASLSRSTVVKALDELEAVGLIDRDRSGGRRRTSYWLTVPQQLQLSTRGTVRELDSSGVDNPVDKGVGDRYGGSPTVQSTDPNCPVDDANCVTDDPNCPVAGHEGVEGFREGEKEEGRSSSGDDERGLSPVEDQDPPNRPHYRAGRQFVDLLDDGKVTPDDVERMTETLTDEGRKDFLDGLRDGRSAA